MLIEHETEFARDGALSEFLYADDLVLMCETISPTAKEHMEKAG